MGSSKTTKSTSAKYQPLLGMGVENCEKRETAKRNCNYNIQSCINLINADEIVRRADHSNINVE